MSLFLVPIGVASLHKEPEPDGNRASRERDHHSPATESELSQVITLQKVFLPLGKGDVIEASGLLGFLEELETKRWNHPHSTGA